LGERRKGIRKKKKKKARNKKTNKTTKPTKKPLRIRVHAQFPITLYRKVRRRE